MYQLSYYEKQGTNETFGIIESQSLDFLKECGAMYDTYLIVDNYNNIVDSKGLAQC